MKMKFCLQTTLWLMLLAAASVAAGPPAQGEQDAAGELRLTLEVPLASPLFAETPVASVDDEPITLKELQEAMAAMHAEVGGKGAPPAGKDFRNVLERLINTRLIIREAKNIGLEKTETIKAQLDEFTERLLLQELLDRHLQGLEPDAAEVEQLYRQMSREVRLAILVFTNQEAAGAFVAKIRADGDFDKFALEAVAAGKAKITTDEHYVKFKDLLPEVAQAASEMKAGAVSKVFQTGKDFLLFKVEDIRFVEDPAVKEEARQIALERARKEKSRQYGDELFKKYVTLDEKLFDELDFEKEKSGYLWFAEEKPVEFKKFTADKRVLAVVHDDPPITVTVGDFARELEKKFFHGTEKAADRKSINKRKNIVLENMMFRQTGLIEARRLGLDQTAEHREAVSNFENSTLFSAFVDKVIVPDIKLKPEEVQAYYDEHRDEYSSPVMLRMNSLVFAERTAAEEALAKLHKGADFKWVSANSAGLVDREKEKVKPFDATLLSINTLPEELQDSLRNAAHGDSVLYQDPDGFYYVLAMAEVHPPQIQDFMQVRDEIARKIRDARIKEQVTEWTAKLKDVYETRIFLK